MKESIGLRYATREDSCGSGDIIDNHDNIHIAAQGDINIQVELDIGLGKTLEIEPYDMLTLPIVNELIDE